MRVNGKERCLEAGRTTLKQYLLKEGYKLEHIAVERNGAVSYTHLDVYKRQVQGRDQEAGNHCFRETYAPSRVLSHSGYPGTDGEEKRGI